eukprot:Gb_19334 [translate_table: standard]
MAQTVLNQHLIIFTDGGSRGNPGPSTTGWIIKTHSGDDLINAGLFLPYATNNIVEYVAVNGYLTDAHAFQPSHIDLFTDSMLVVNQLNQLLEVTHPVLRTYETTTRSLLVEFLAVRLRHIHRELNTDADHLSPASLKALKRYSKAPNILLKLHRSLALFSQRFGGNLEHKGNFEAFRRFEDHATRIGGVTSQHSHLDRFRVHLPLSYWEKVCAVQLPSDPS